MFNGNVNAEQITATQQHAGGDINITEGGGLSEDQTKELVKIALDAANKGNQQEMRKTFVQVVGETGADFMIKFLQGLGGRITNFFI